MVQCQSNASKPGPKLSKNKSVEFHIRDIDIFESALSIAAADVGLSFTDIAWQKFCTAAWRDFSKRQTRHSQERQRLDDQDEAEHEDREGE